MRVTHVAWLNSGAVGVVRVYDAYTGPKFYIKGIGPQIERDERNDVILTAQYGSTISQEIGSAIIREYGRQYLLEY